MKEIWLMRLRLAFVDSVAIGVGLTSLVLISTARAGYCRSVGPDEIDPGHGHISMNAPLARALLGKSLDQHVDIELPAGDRECCIIGMEYPTGD